MVDTIFQSDTFYKIITAIFLISYFYQYYNKKSKIAAIFPVLISCIYLIIFMAYTNRLYGHIDNYINSTNVYNYLFIGLLFIYAVVLSVITLLIRCIIWYIHKRTILHVKK